MIKHLLRRSHICINPFQYKSMPSMKTLRKESVTLFEEINAVVEKEVELAGIRDAEPEKMLQNWTSTPILIPQTPRYKEII